MSFPQLTPKQFENLLDEMEESAAKSSVDPPSLFRHLTPEDRKLLGKLMVEEACGAGEIIFQEGDVGDTVYLIRSGRVVAVIGHMDSPTVLGSRGPGEVIGEMALLEDAPRSASVISLEPMTLMKIGRRDFQELLRQNPAASMSIMATLSQRLRQADNARNVVANVDRSLQSQVSSLESEKEQLIGLQRAQQEMSDLIIHDLRNPLALMYGAINMLEVVLPEEEVEANRSLFEIVNTAYAKMQRLVDSLLDVAKMESGKAVLNPTPTSLPKIINDVIQMAQYALKTRNIHYDSSIPDDIPEIMLDEERISRVLSNLTDNSIKFMPKGGKLHIGVEKNSSYVKVSVADTGPGIPPEDRKRIFERFAQVSEEGRPKPKRRGFGLGLLFCHLTVEAHGGRIWVEPGDEGVGSRFVFTLPMSTQN